MLPILAAVGPIKIYTLGIFLLMAFFWGMFVLWRNIKLTSYREEDIFDGFFLSLLGAIFFARLFFVIGNFSEFGLSFFKFILINGYPGLSLYGGLIGGMLFSFLYSISKKIDFRKFVDYASGPLLTALAVANVGAFLAGVEIGTKTSFPLAVVYSGYKGLRHITALYQALIFFMAIFAAQRILLSIRKQTYPEGFSGVFFIWIFSGTTLFLDKIKVNHLYFWNFNVNLWLSTILFIVTTTYFLYFFRKTLFENIKSLPMTLKNNGKNLIKKIARRDTSKAN